MKKMLTIFMIVVALVVCMIPFVSAADTDPALTVTPDVTEAKPGDTVTVTVAIINNPGYSAANVQMSATGLTLTAMNSAFGDNAEYFLATGKICWSRASNWTAATQELFTATYTIPVDAAAGNYVITAKTYDSGIRSGEQTVIAGDVAFTATIHVCADANNDHFCDDTNCGDRLSQCVNADTDDHECDICGETLSQCTSNAENPCQAGTCTVCGEPVAATADHQYFSPCEKFCMNCGEETNPTASHTMTHHEAVEPTCDVEGNIEYWTCSACGGAWTDANGNGIPLGRFGWVLGAAGHDLTHYEAVEPTCDTEGNIEYWRCETCGAAFADEDATLPIAKDRWILGVNHANVAHIEAVEPGCHFKGNVEYWICNDCGACWLDEAQTQVTNALSVVLPELGGGDVVHMEAVEPSCHFEGHIEHWYCNECEQVWQDEALTQLTNHQNVVLPELGGEVIHVEAKDPTCYEEGNIEHWYCEECEQVWQDEARTQLTNHQNVVRGAEHTRLVHMDAVEPGCHFEGNIEYWVCHDCGGVWQDELLRQVTNILNVRLPELGGEVVHVEAKAPTCTENGNIEHWYCEECEQVWQNEERTQLTNHLNVVVAATGHTLVKVEAKAATKEADGNIEHWYCSVCGKYFADAEATEEITKEETIVTFNPETGDSSMLIPAALLALMSITGAALLVSKKNLMK